jgi:hypothetical protein
MAWIESHQEIAQHPKTRKLARLLNVSTPQAIGHLHLLWWWAFDYAQDGDLSRYQPEDIADAALWEGSASLFLSALLDAGFLDQPDGHPCIHDWNKHGGKLLAKRRSDADRKRSTGVPTDVQRNSTGVPTDVQRRSQVDKRRVEESTGEEDRARPRAAAAAPEEPEFSETDLAVGRLCRSWESSTSTTVTAALGEKLSDWLETLPEAAIVKAISETGAAGARNWRYCEAILRRYQAEGWADKPPAATVQRFVESGLFSPTGVYVGRPVWEDEAEAAAQSPAPQVAS